jgi:hypothetical protein
MWSLVKKPQLGGKHVFLVQVCKGGIEFLKERFKFIEQKWMTFKKNYEQNKKYCA